MVYLSTIINLLIISFILSNYPLYSLKNNNLYTINKYLSIYPIFLIFLEYKMYEHLVLFPLFYFISDIDNKYQEIPNISYLILIIFFYNRLQINIINIFIIGILIIFAYKEYLGFGDIKLLFVLSLIFTNDFLYILFLSSLYCLIHNYKKRDITIPFAPYICLAVFTILIFQ